MITIKKIENNKVLRIVVFVLSLTISAVQVYLMMK